MPHSQPIDPDQADASDPLDRAITEYALKLVRRRAELSDQDVEVARRTGRDAGLRVEIVAHVALNGMTNDLNKLADTAIDFPVLDLQSAA